MVTQAGFIGVLYLSWLTLVLSEQNHKSDNHDSGPIPIEDYIRQQGYPVESHDIYTADGYILTYHRIPRGQRPDEPGAGVTRRPVLLQHGLLASSAGWVITSDSLGFSLVDAGFDLWLGNARGNTYSRKHTRYDPDKDKRAFWSFSWHEMGYYDLPASIDYILNVTKQPQLLYIGHSMGTTMFFVLGAMRPEYMAKVMAAVLLAPVAFPQHVKSPLTNFLLRMNSVTSGILKSLDIYEILPNSNKTYWIDSRICSNQQLQFICEYIIFEISGFDAPEANRTALSIALNYVPAGAALKQLEHYSQICKKGASFQQFDYGFFENMWTYHTPQPPPYNMSNVLAPVYIQYAANDWLAVPEDVLYTAQTLPNVQGVREVPFHLFNHLDFMWSIDAKGLLYDDIINTLQNISLSLQAI